MTSFAPRMDATIAAGMQINGERAIDEAQLPGGQERLDQAEAARATLTKHGYRPIGIDHFAKPKDPLFKAHKAGRLRRNFQGYTVDPATALIGFGASSIGSFEPGYIQNEPHIGKYKEAVRRGELPVTRGIAVSDDDRRTRPWAVPTLILIGSSSHTGPTPWYMMTAIIAICQEQSVIT